jgi:uncharacterized protein (DUF1501 family)
MCGATALGLSMPLFMQRIEAEAASTNTILVVIEQNGGNDMFNTIVNLGQYGTYTGLRSNIALPESSLAATQFDANISTPANESTEYAFHPWMTAMRSTWATGKLALMTSVGLPPNTSNRDDHETARFSWQTGTINEFGIADTGWCGLIADQITTTKGALPAMISVNYSSPTIMLAKNNTALVIGSGDISGFKPNLGGSSTADNTFRQNSINDNSAYALASMPAEFARATEGDTEAYVGALATVLAQESLSDYVTTYAFGGPGTTATNSALKTSLKQVARMILSGAASRVYWVSQGGYDTHSNQINAQAPLLGELSEAMSQFYSYMNRSGNSTIGQNVVAMTITDFGRRANSNSTEGTDHGTTLISFVLGAKVTGGIYGGYPSLTNLDSNGNALVAVDFRNEISDICQAMGADPSTIVGQTYTKIGFI